MARGKKGKKSKAIDVASQEAVETESSFKRKEQQSSRRFRWWDYVVIGLFFVIFCEVQQYFAAWFIGAEDNVTRGNVEMEALNFLYGTMWKSFLVVLVLVWAYDYFYHDSEQDTT